MSPPAARFATPAREALQSALTAISAAGCETPRLDAELLLAAVLGVERAQLLTDPSLAVAGAQVRELQAAVRRRAVEREPVAYILGRRAFRDLDLAVDPRALIPRPETELLVEVGAELAREGARVLDLGTGSGAVALALAHERPDLRLEGADLSAAALELARANGRRLGLDVAWTRSDLLADLPGPYELILGNLPYVGLSERARLAPEIVRHEPPQALFAGADGLDAFRALAAQLVRREDPGLLALEIGVGQGAAVGELLRAAGFAEVEGRADLAGIERVIVARREPS